MSGKTEVASPTLEPGKTPQALTIRPDQGDASLLWVSEDWAVWRKSQMIEETRTHRASSFNHWYYRQRLSENEAVLVHTERDLGGAPCLAVTADGTLIMAKRGPVSWHHQNGQVKESPPDHWISLVQSLYPDGVLVQRSAGIHAPEPVIFTPFKGEQLDFDRAVEVVPRGVKNFRDSEPVRHKDVFAWLSTSAIHYFDLKSRNRWQVTPATDIHPPNRVCAFDGQTVAASFAWAFDATTGAVLGNSDYVKRRGYVRPFAVRNRIGYSIQDGWLVGTDLTAQASESAPLARVLTQPIGQGSKGLILWTGRDWKTIPWLESLPVKESPVQK